MAIASKKTARNSKSKSKAPSRRKQKGSAKHLALGMTAVCSASALVGAGIYKLFTLA